MEGMPRFAFAAALTVALTLTLLLAVLLLLLANLFCSLLRRRAAPRPRREPAPSPEEPSPDRPLSLPFYAHGVLQAPAKFLLSVPSLDEAVAKSMAARPSPPPPPPPPRKAAEDFVCISNPIYDGVSVECGGGGGGDGSTPFVTPKASPSGLDGEEGLAAARDQLGGDDDCSPPLKLMKRLPPAPLPRRATTLAACLVDGRRSLATSTETNRPSSSSSSNSLCSSPSW